MSLIKFITGRRTKFVVLLFWLLAVFALGAKAGKFESVQKNDSKSYLPATAESLRSIELESKQTGEQLPGLLVFYRAAGLTDADKRAIEGDAAAINKQRLQDQLGDARTAFAKDGKTATLAVTVIANGNGDDLRAVAKEIRDTTNDDPPGMTIKLTGGIGFSDDAIAIFNSMGGTVLIGTSVLVIVLLLLIYRSPILWLLPLISVGCAESVSRGFGTMIAESGTTVNGQAAIMMTILIFGVGTDYALLLISRYREELRRHEDRHEAMAFALRKSAPAILASAGTVVLALMTMIFGELNSTSSTGPMGAMGVALAMLAMLTMLPALLLIGGRSSFWPFIPRFHSTDHFAASGFWSGLADFVQRRRGVVIVGMLALIAVMSLGWTKYDSGLTQTDSYTKKVDSVEGQKILQRTLPPGAVGPVVIMTTRPADAQKIADSVRKVRGVSAVNPPRVAKGIARVEATLGDQPYSDAARDVLANIRGVAKATGGTAVAVGGVTAIDVDTRKSQGRDNRLIIPIALIVVFLILMVLLRSLVAPVVLILTVVASFFAVLGLSFVVFDKVFGFVGVDTSFPLWVFVFLVALGVDYNIFLMARVREEVQKHGSAEGMRRGLVATGGVITSAAAVLAGTFTVMGALPLVFLAEIGFSVAFGVLFDAMLVRSVLVPAIVWALDRRIWWPSALSKQP
ncbi:MAG: MMPL family transporter [Actinobacteria bacterium]|nr:MMPL family transporter [Actinomycetota bacterium]